jgi:hypothetical protein
LQHDEMGRNDGCGAGGFVWAGMAPSSSEPGSSGQVAGLWIGTTSDGLAFWSTLVRM